MAGSTHPRSKPLRLLSQSLARFVAEDAHITHVARANVRSGMSGAAVRRHTIRFTSAGQSLTTSLITKATGLREWQVLRHLNNQNQPNVPFTHALDDTYDGQVLICMQDLGDTYRPTSLEPITDDELEKEAVGLAAIHAANFQQGSALNWLPHVSRVYIQEMIFQRAWRPSWEKAVANTTFVDTFRSAIPKVETAAADIVKDIAMLLDDPHTQTLIHADINPSNVMVHEGKPYFIDWQSAMWGPFYLDLPHHHCTLAQAEYYRHALASLGHAISPGDFAERYSVAARYIGLRYMWWTLEAWLADPSQTPWVNHYIGLVNGDKL